MKQLVACHQGGDRDDDQQKVFDDGEQRYSGSTPSTPMARECAIFIGSGTGGPDVCIFEPVAVMSVVISYPTRGY